MKDLYKTIGVSKTASADEIKKRYRKLTKELHPDRNPGDKAAEERFKDVSTAYDVLSDSNKRELYDEFGEVSLTQGFDEKRARAYKQAQSGFGGMGGGSDNIFSDFGEAKETRFDDLLSRLFGGGRIKHDFGPPRNRKGSDIRGDVTVSLMDALHGVTVPLRVDGQLGDAKTLDVKVPQGMPDGATLRLRGQGGSGSPRGDILLTVKVTPHARLSREGDNLRMMVPVTALEAYRGGPIDVRTPWGTVTVKLPPGSQNGQVLRLRGRGVRRGERSGDLMVVLDVRMPAPGDEPLLEALSELQGKEDPRKGLDL